MPKLFSSNVKVLMREKKVTIEQVVQQHGLSRATLHKLRQNEGISECRLSTLGRIADALGVSTKELYDEQEDPTPHDANN